MGAQEEDDDEDIKSSTRSIGVPPPPVIEVQSLLEKAKFYTSLCLGTTAILAAFGFLFLIPFVVEPSISTILADYSSHPVACMATEHVYAEGLKNCSWASCREGCTSAALRCHQIRVNYSRLPYDEFMRKPHGNLHWDVNDTKFFVNTEGCGYPPRVNCSEFAKKFGYRNLGKIFPCYYSKAYPDTVVARYSWDDNLRNLILALTVPISLFFISIAILCYWYCPPANKTCGGSSRNLLDKYPRKEEMKVTQSSPSSFPLISHQILYMYRHASLIYDHLEQICMLIYHSRYAFEKYSKSTSISTILLAEDEFEQDEEEY